MNKRMSNRKVMELIAETTGSKLIKKKLRNEDILNEYYAQIKKGNESGYAVRIIKEKYNLSRSQVYRIIQSNVK